MKKNESKQNSKYSGIILIVFVGLIIGGIGYLLLSRNEKLEPGEFTLTDLTVKVVDKNSTNPILDDNIFPQGSDLNIVISFKGAEKNTKLKIVLKSTDKRDNEYSKSYSKTLEGDGEEKIDIDKSLPVGNYQISATQGETQLSIYNFVIE